VDPVENTQRFGDAQIMTKLSVSDKPETHLFHVFPTFFCGLDATSTRPSPEKHWAEVSWGWFGDFGATPDLYISGSRQTLRNKSMSQRSIASQLTQNSSFRTSPRYQAQPCPTAPLHL